MSIKQTRSGPGRKSSPLVLGFIVIGATLALAVTDASAGRGGGGRGGGGGSGGQMAQSSVSGANRSAGGGGQAASANRSSGSAGANRSNVNSGNRGDVNSGNRGDVNSGNRVNTGNVNVGNDVNINIDGGYGYRGGGVYHPVAAAATIGAIAVTTAAVVGSYYHALPAGCTTVVMNGATYSQCGTVYYQQTWQGSDPVYVVVNP